jgi:hypothetical protein
LFSVHEKNMLMYFHLVSRHRNGVFVHMLRRDVSVMFGIKLRWLCMVYNDTKIRR